jgi:hypothetical protein
MDGINAFVELALQQSVHKSIRAGVKRSILKPALRELRREFGQKCDEIVDGFRNVQPSQFTGDMNRVDLGESIRHMARRLQRVTDSVTRGPPIAWSFLTALPSSAYLLSAARSWELAYLCLRVCLLLFPLWILGEYEHLLAFEFPL